MSESKLGDKTLKVDHVLNIAEQSLLCYTLIDVLNTREKEVVLEAQGEVSGRRERIGACEVEVHPSENLQGNG